MTTPCVSIIICTRNRAEHLAQTLEAIAKVRVSAELPTELLVVDNGSTDHTREVVESSQFGRLPARYVREGGQGQSHARNAGMAAGKGVIILFTDDDVRPPENWLHGMCHPILSGHGDVVAGGVRIAAQLERPWMAPFHRDWLACSARIDPVTPQRMIGANMAFSRRVLERVPAFDPELGPGALGFGDDSLFFRQCSHAGYRAASALGVVVEHHFDPSRLSRASLLDAARRRGRVRAYVAYHWQHRDIRSPLRDLCWIARRNLRWRIRNWRECQAAEGAPEWELQQLLDLYFCKHYLAERKRPRRYEKHGLALLPVCPPAERGGPTRSSARL